MISLRHGFVYIHIGKTGGNSVSTALAPFSEARIEFRPSAGKVQNEDGEQGVDVFNDEFGLTEARDKHATYERYAEVLGEKIRSLFVFASVRNPYDRVASATAFRRGTKGNPFSADELVMPRPQANWLFLKDEWIVRDLIHFENFQSDFDTICSRIGIARQELPHKNASNRPRDFNLCLDESAKERIQTHYRLDFETLGYAM